MFSNLLNTVLPWRNTTNTESRPKHKHCPGEPIVADMYHYDDPIAGYDVFCPECGEKWSGKWDEVPLTPI